MKQTRTVSISQSLNNRKNIRFSRAQNFVAQYGTPLLLLSHKAIRKNYRNLKSALPGVELFYAVKANATPEIIQILADEGCSFDLSTPGETVIARRCGIDARRCIHTHPIKNDMEIRDALEYGIKLFIVENDDEIVKLLPYRDTVELLVRLRIENPSCPVNLSRKYGVSPAKAYSLVKKARNRGLVVSGLSFHVGSQNDTPQKFIEALQYCRDICQASAGDGVAFDIIDIGGGFPVKYLKKVPSINKYCQPINEYLERHFRNYRIIAEPGRYICANAMSLVTGVKGRALRDGIWWYYLDDGLYGSFSGKLYDHAEYPFYTERKNGPLHKSVLAGPTCDSIDVVYEDVMLPSLNVGDLIMFNSMGAYTSASASTFNGFTKTRVAVLD
ncbi:MAG: type III PLP-dependent enzyme [Chitinispirillaceae bacterium]|nr:type III PLP-dependent enzyme [Chitinispirillaceae bacterium]